jgi:hypothetical protein
MDLTELRKELDKLVSIALEKGLKKPRAEAQFQSNTTNVNFWFWYEDDADIPRSKYFFGPEGEVLSTADSWLLSLPSRDERNRAEYRKAVAHAIDLGKKFGIEDAAINPLKEVMEKLSKNVLEHKTGDDLF